MKGEKEDRDGKREGREGGREEGMEGGRKERTKEFLTCYMSVTKKLLVEVTEPMGEL